MKTAPYGEWPSLIEPEAIAAAGLKIGQIAWDGRTLLWEERRPSEGGRTTIVRAVDGRESYEDLIPTPYSVRSAVHEYGGGAFCVHAGWVWFVNSEDQAIYCRNPDGAIHRITRFDEHRFFADLQIDSRHKCLYAVCEDHDSDTEPAASVVAVGFDGAVTELASGRDFYASPRLSPHADTLVWLTWDHPDMPWDNTELWRADIDGEGRIAPPECVVGGTDESLFAPTFAPDGRLYLASDRDHGWWNIQRVEQGGLIPITHEVAEFAVPQWVFGQSTFAFDTDGRLYALMTQNGLWQLVRVDMDSGALSVFDLPVTDLAQLRIADGRMAFIAGSATTPTSLYTMTVAGENWTTVQAPQALALDEAALSTPEALTYATANDETAHALYYPPCNPEMTASASERPPLLIKCHGGPTGATATALDPRIQFWTSRGFAILDVNYRGSTGYGRAYRRSLYGRWGVADVEDCVHGARHLADQDLIDPERVAISGSSAGGYTVLAVLAFADIATAGASYYGIGDLERLLESTHKFESRYLRKLIGENRALLRERSPLHHAANLECPVLFLQGGQDKVVPPDQAEDMAAALRQRGLPVAHVVFPEERHGFRDADNITTAIGSELAFYGLVMGFTPDAALPDPGVENLPS